jgi:hypothetical protein
MSDKAVGQMAEYVVGTQLHEQVNITCVAG